MRAEWGRIPRAGWVTVAVLMAAGPLAARTGHAQSFRGVAEVQYANLSRAATPQDLESWQTTFQIDHSTRLRGQLLLSSQFRWNELTYQDRPDRTRTPQGSIRLSHPFYGMAVSYRPTTVTDALNYTQKQQELRVTSYFSKPGLPQLTGSWARRHVDATVDFPGGSSIRRDLSGTYARGVFDFRAAYGDQSRETARNGDRKNGDDRIGFGSTGHFRGVRWNATGHYDFNQTRKIDGSDVVRISRLHTAGANGSLRLSRRTTGSLNYSLQHNNIVRPQTASLTEHDGTVSVGHELSRVFRASAGGGVRSASIGGNRETESFALASLTASAQVRPGWTFGSGLNHSYNWLPSERPRPITSFQASTLMRLAPRLEVNGSLGATHATRPLAAADTVGARRQATLQAGAGIRATPRPPITIALTASRSRSAATIGWDGDASTSYTGRVDWKPYEALQLNGAWSRASGFRQGEPHRTTVQASSEWNPTRFLQAAGTYTRFNQPIRDPNTSLSGNRQAFGGRLVLGLTRDLRATIQYSEADPDLPTQSEQVTVTVTQSFRR
jgi:hypothetical protein